MVELLMESEVQAVADIAVSVGVREDDLVVSVFVVGLPVLVPGKGWCPVIGIADVLYLDGWGLIFPNGEKEFLHLQAAVVIDGVKIGDW